jgi:hypothetical protein
VALGSCLPRAPTDPYVRALAHTAPQIVGSLPVSAIRLCFVDTLSKARCLRRISQRRFHYSTPRFPPPGRLGQSSPISSVLSRRSDFLPSIPRHFVAFVRRYHTIALVLLLSHGKCHRVSPELVTRYLQPGFVGGNDRTSQVPGRPQLSVCSCSTTPASRYIPDQMTPEASVCRTTALALAMGTTKALARNNLSKLNHMASGLAVYASLCSLPHATQDSLPAVGQTLPDGLSTRRVTFGGFKFTSCQSSSSAKLLGAIP